MVILAAVLLAVAVAAWPARDRLWRGTGGLPATGPLIGSATGAATGGGLQGGTARPWPWGRARRDARDGEELLLLLDAIAPALAAGLPPAAALAHLTRRGRSGGGTGDPRAGPVDALLADLVAEANAGRPLAPVWNRHAHEGLWGRSGWSGEVAFVARAWSLSESLGSPLAECATVAARAVRQQSARRQRLAIALAGPRATAAVLTALPLAGPVVGLLLGLPPQQLYATPVAVVSTLVGLALLLLGRWWCARLVAGIGRRGPTRGSRPRGSPTGRRRHPGVVGR